MQNTTMPNRASDAGPEEQPMDLGDWLFELMYAAEEANRLHTKDQPAKTIADKLERVEECLRRAKGLL